jgi:hypothetical protein
MSDWFPLASELRSRKQKSIRVQEEIMAIQHAIMYADEAGSIEVTISSSDMTLPNSPGSTAEQYYSVWKQQTVNRLLDIEMTEVIDYFKRLGYSISRATNPDTETTFVWEIKW